MEQIDDMQVRWHLRRLAPVVTVQLEMEVEGGLDGDWSRPLHGSERRRWGRPWSGDRSVKLWARWALDQSVSQERQMRSLRNARRRVLARGACSEGGERGY